MKKISIMTFTLLLILSCFNITACGGREKNTTAPTQTQAQQQTTTGSLASAITPVSEDSQSWSDMPIYSGAKEVLKVRSDKNESLHDKPAVFEQRLYNTPDKRADVVDFYKSKMPANGWTENTWMEMGASTKGSSLGEYEKDNQQAIATVTCGDSEKGTVITLSKKYIK